MRMTRALLRIGIILAVVAGVATLIFPITSRPITWDELLYMGRAFSPEADARILNRYTHVYLLSIFMWLLRDPYLGTQVMWSVGMAATLVAMFMATSSLALAQRVCVLSLATFLLLGIDTISWGFGIAYVDHTLMTLTTISVAVVLPTILAQREFTWRQALMLGLLFGWSLRTKEVALAMVILPLVFFATPQGQVRISLHGISLLLVHLLAAAAALGTTVVGDWLILGDGTFYLRGESWALLREFNDIQGEGFTSPYSWMSWLLRPENFTAFFLYLLTLVPALAILRDARLAVVYLLPLSYLAVFLASASTGNSVVVPRYSIVFLPTLCIVVGHAISTLLAAARTRREEATARNDEATAAAPATAVKRSDIEQWAAAVLALVMLSPFALRYLGPPAAQQFFDQVRLLDLRALNELVQPGAVIIGMSVLALALTGPRWLRMPGCFVTLAVLLATGVNPMLRVANSLVWRDLRQYGEARFADLRQLIHEGAVPATARIAFEKEFEKHELYDRGPFFLRTLIGMQLRERMPTDRLMFVPELLAQPASEVLRHEFVFASNLTATKLRESLLARGVSAEIRQIDGKQGRLSLLCIPQTATLSESQPSSSVTTTSDPTTKRGFIP